MFYNICRLFFIFGALSLVGCVVGPDFISPQNRFSQSDDSLNYRQLEADSKYQPIIDWQDQDQENIKDWWKSFNNPTINNWVEQALKHSPDVQMAHFALLQAQALADEGAAHLYPDVNFGANVSHQKISTIPLIDNSPTKTYTLHNVGVNVNYIFDVFGGVRRANEYRKAAFEAQRWETDAAMSTIAANVINLLINISSINEQLVTYQKLIDLQQDQVDLAYKQIEIGAISNSELLPIKANLSALKAVIPTLIAQRAGFENQLYALSGQFPQNKHINIKLANIQVPKSIPLWLPSSLVSRRPDIRAAEAKLHQATANVGIAKSGYYPNIAIAGSISSQAINLANLLKTNLWSIALSLTQKLFDGGENLAKKAQADAGLKLAQASYQKVVLNAFSEISNLLINLSSDNQSIDLYRDAQEDSEKSYQIYRKKFNIGSSSVFDLINSEKIFLQTQIDLIKAQSTQLSNIVAIYLAAGGIIDWQAYQIKE